MKCLWLLSFCLFFNGQYLQFLSVFWRGTILTHFFNERQWWLGQRFQRRHFWPLLSAIMEYSWKNPSSLWNQIKLLKNRDLPWNHILQTKNPNCILIPTWDTKLRSLSHFRKSEIWHWIRIFLFFLCFRRFLTGGKTWPLILALFWRILIY